MRIEKWEAGAKVEHPCSKLTEMLIIEGEAHDGELLCVAFLWPLVHVFAQSTSDTSAFEHITQCSNVSKSYFILLMLISINELLHGRGDDVWTLNMYG